MLGLETRDLTVFGDDINDISMFEQAGRAVAVANAIEPVKEKAHLLIGSNCDDSVARFIGEEFSSQ
jgi:5-amino-6-(5-phospho-D-ribitylamino)uracil phosphatase